LKAESEYKEVEKIISVTERSIRNWQKEANEPKDKSATRPPDAQTRVCNASSFREQMTREGGVTEQYRTSTGLLQDCRWKYGADRDEKDMNYPGPCAMIYVFKRNRLIAQNNFCAKIMKRHLDRANFPGNKSRETVHVHHPRALPT
jgi:hypothetical protein